MMRTFHGAAVNETCIHVHGCNFQAAQHEQPQLMYQTSAKVQYYSALLFLPAETHQEIVQHLSCSHAQLWTMVDGWQGKVG
jgi:hypothetical protein